MDLSAQYLTPAELSTRLKGLITTKTLANWRSLNQGPAYSRWGNRVVYRIEDVEQWERERMFRGTGVRIQPTGLAA